MATLDEEVWRATGPGTPHPRLRLEALTRHRPRPVTVRRRRSPGLAGATGPEELDLAL